MVICQRRASMLSSARISAGDITSISYKRCCYRYKHVAASALADNDAPDGVESSDGAVEEAGQLSTNKSLLGPHPSEASALLTMAAQINPNNEAQSPSSPKVAQLHARPSIDETAEDRDNGHEEVWSDDDAEEEGPKRKRPRPLSAS